MTEPKRVELIDAHCHYADIEAPLIEPALTQARQQGLVQALMCPAQATDFTNVSQFSQRHGLAFMLGIHPFEYAQAMRFLPDLIAQLNLHKNNALFCGIGEIGLDFSANILARAHDSALAKNQQLELFRTQLKLAATWDLPVCIHARQSLSWVIQTLREFPVKGGIIHAFNGSFEQAQECIHLGMKLGFGATLTYAGSKKIQSVFARLTAHDWVLETDAPWMPTAHRRQQTAPQHVPLSMPTDIFEILQAAARIRQSTPESIAQQAYCNTLKSLHRTVL